jgi:hypothetical protein
LIVAGVPVALTVLFAAVLATKWSSVTSVPATVGPTPLPASASTSSPLRPAAPILGLGLIAIVLIVVSSRLRNRR